MDASSEIKSLFGEMVTNFESYAEFDKHLDRVVYRSQDCSELHIRKNRYITLIYDVQKYDEGNDNNEPVGIVIKGIRYLLNALGFSENHTLTLSELIAKLIEKFGDGVNLSSTKPFKEVNVEIEGLVAA